MKARTLNIICLTLCIALSGSFLLAQSDPLSGTWSGDWGPTATHRNQVTVQLCWNGSELTGIVNPDTDAIALTMASFDSETGELVLEAEAAYHGAMTRYSMAGKLEGNTMMGSWKHDNTDGDFKLTKQ